MLSFFASLSRLWQIVIGVVVLLLAIWAFLFVRDLFVGTKDVEADLGTEQAGAAIESGEDAVNTVGDNQDRADATDDKVKETENAVNEADSAADADRVARERLCQQFGACE